MGKDLKGKELGTGLSQLKDGRYVIRWTDNYGKRNTKYAKKLKEAKEILVKETYAVQSYQDVGTSTKVRVGDLFQIYFRYATSKYKDNTLFGIRSSYNKYVKDRFSNLPLLKVNKLMLQQYLSELAGMEGCNPRLAVGILRRLFTFAQDEGYITRNPTSNLVYKNKRVQNSKDENDKVMTVEEQLLFLDYIQDENNQCYNKNLFMFILGTGLRIGECLALTRGSVDLEDNTVTVERTLSRKYNDEGRDEITFKSPKTARSKRVVPLTQLAVKAVNSQIEKFNSVGVVLNKDDLLFPKWKKRGFVVASQTSWDIHFSGVVKHIREVYPTFPRITPHSLRHTYATRCYEIGISPKATQNWLGHSSLSMTQYYQHLTAENAAPEIAKLNAEFKLV